MKVQIHVIIEKEIKEKLEQLAEKDGRSLNNLIDKVLREFVEGKKSKRFNPSTDVGFMLMNKRVNVPLYGEVEGDWHTGTPTEAGLYVIAYRFGNKIEHEIREMYYSPDYGMTFGIKKDIVAWQKIEPYEEEK